MQRHKKYHSSPRRFSGHRRRPQPSGLTSVWKSNTTLSTRLPRSPRSVQWQGYEGRPFCSFCATSYRCPTASSSVHWSRMHRKICNNLVLVLSLTCCTRIPECHSWPPLRFLRMAFLTQQPITISGLSSINTKRVIRITVRYGTEVSK